MKYCKVCNEQLIPPARFVLGYRTCLPCGEAEAKKRVHPVVPLHKSNYIVVSNRADLVGINTKGA